MREFLQTKELVRCIKIVSEIPIQKVREFGTFQKGIEGRFVPSYVKCFIKA